MNKTIPVDRDNGVIDVGPPRRRRWLRWLILGVIAVGLAAPRSLSIYVSALWFGSLGYQQVYWYTFKLKAALFVIFALLTLLIVGGGLWLLERVFSLTALGLRVIIFNERPVQVSPARIIRPVAWIVAILAAVVSGSSMLARWRTFAVYLHQTPTDAIDPIFHKPVGFYLFGLPVHQLTSWWLLCLAFMLLCAAIVYTVVSMPGPGRASAGRTSVRGRSVAAVSCTLAPYLLILAWRVFLSRYPYLWEDHQLSSGVTYVEAHFLLPGLLIVAGGLTVAAAVAMLNAAIWRRWSILAAAIALPVAIHVVAITLVPAYVTSFIVKPNELARETPYIQENMAWTRRAFGIDRIERRSFDAETSTDAFELQSNRATLDNIRLWDWRALRDTLTQVQAIRTYYDFTDVDVDRYVVGGQQRQMMLATREINVDKLPPSSRNWVNERLIYTHGYGLTMNTANGFDAEGMPKFVLWNMPIESTAPELTLTRPEIYYGQETDTDVYVNTKQREFNYPQGATNSLTTYEGTGGIRLGGTLRRLLLSIALDDVAKLPFSDDVTPESRALIHRNIRDLVEGVAPFLIFDDDPYIVVSGGRLYWIIDAFTESGTYPYSRHYQAGDREVNYIRNSVKVVIDAYNGDAKFYIFDPLDPLIATYRSVFPTLFRDAREMPADVRAHVRYPETLFKTQADVFALYHIQDTKVFFQREDAWSIARQVVLDERRDQREMPVEPYFVLMQLPGEESGIEFVEILPFTPSNRNNMIGWLASRCDGDAYGSLLVYEFPKSRLIDGPLQVEARIDQDAQLSGQFTLWNQQGSHVARGHLLVIPIGRSLLYVEPVYLQAERSPMPELRLVVLATQGRLAHGLNFDEALANLFGDSAKPAREVEAQQPSAAEAEAAGRPSPSPPVGVQSLQQLIDRALREFEEYQRLTAEGKLGEAGKKLEEHKRTLEELKKASGISRR